jgi:hypothetical protein
VTLTGTALGLAPGQTVWIALLDPTARRYYPERRPLTTARDGTWTAKVALGPTSAAGRRYQVLLVLADARSATKLTTYGARAGAGTGAGLGRLPAGTVTLASLSLRRS